ncbi:MerR family transcriptional regulator [Alteromonas sp. 76-1]|jgi:Cd(II)/Pb(II)-responsive transcriptional regulator|uniref:Cd(II)/Pb(II)-responsive transcriptional regulator n=1 Tax=unclassified Alteromonas TaxID=2614992 RepID=UPI000509D158|nr:MULTISPECIES: Cd(II)/Pb(II)-responsive transcriptional regulator [unclassified Alteromonas]VEL97186.1 MerR family transcriptional regulator [Alteromonas sp. 76-1]
MKIGQLADKTGLSIQTIRFYERKALLAAPQRTQSNYRSYSDEALKQLLFIKQCRSLDMTIEEISLVLETRTNPESSCENVNATMDKHIDDIKHRISELNALQKTLKSMRAACNDDKKIKECGVLHRIDSIVDSHCPAKRND